VRRRASPEETLHVVVNRDDRPAELEAWIVSGARHDLLSDRIQGGAPGSPIVVPPFGVMILATE
jgi:hypothetical protein